MSTRRDSLIAGACFVLSGAFPKSANALYFSAERLSRIDKFRNSVLLLSRQPENTSKFKSQIVIVWKLGESLIDSGVRKIGHSGNPLDRSCNHWLQAIARWDVKHDFGPASQV
jgi:hypothetical protein